MKRAIIEWMVRDAEWWQFWRPDSGIVGGVIFGVIIGFIINIL